MSGNSFAESDERDRERQRERERERGKKPPFQLPFLSTLYWVTCDPVILQAAYVSESLSIRLSVLLLVLPTVSACLPLSIGRRLYVCVTIS